MPSFTRDGRRISYLDTAGDASAPRVPARTLVLLHAFPMAARMWEPQVEAAPPGWRLVAPDFRGFGQSDADSSETDLSMADYAGDTLTLLDVLGVGRAVFVGLSMGGYVAFRVLALAPARVAGVVLADTKAGADSAEARDNRLQMMTLLQQRGVPAVVEQMMPRLLSGATRRQRPAIEARVRAVAGMASAEGIRAALVRLMDRPDSTALLPTTACPALVVVGAEDEVTPPTQARAMQQQIPGARLAEIAGAGHLSNLEQPEAFNEALHGFLSSIRA